MAVLPGEDWLVQQIGETVVVFHRHTEEEVVRFDPSDTNASAKAQLVIDQSDRLSEEQKTFAHFWCGYFYAHNGFGQGNMSNVQRPDGCDHRFSPVSLLIDRCSLCGHTKNV